MAKKTPEQRAETAEKKLRKSLEQFNHLQERHVLLRKEAQKLLANFRELNMQHHAQRMWIEALTKVINESPKDPDNCVTLLGDQDLEDLGLTGGGGSAITRRL